MHCTGSLSRIAASSSDRRPNDSTVSSPSSTTSSAQLPKNPAVPRASDGVVNTTRYRRSPSAPSSAGARRAASIEVWRRGRFSAMSSSRLSSCRCSGATSHGDWTRSAASSSATQRVLQVEQRRLDRGDRFDVEATVVQRELGHVDARGVRWRRSPLRRRPRRRACGRRRGSGRARGRAGRAQRGRRRAGSTPRSNPCDGLFEEFGGAFVVALVERAAPPIAPRGSGRHVAARADAGDGGADHREDGQRTERPARLPHRPAHPRWPPQHAEHEERGADGDPDDRREPEEPVEFRPQERVRRDAAGDRTDRRRRCDGRCRRAARRGSRGTQSRRRWGRARSPRRRRTLSRPPTTGRTRTPR